MQTTKRIFRVNRQDINYIRSTVECYDGMAVVSTLDPYEACVEISISPGCETMVCELLSSLCEKEGFFLVEKILRKEMDYQE